MEGKSPKKIYAILTETLTCLLPARAKDLSAPLYGLRISVRQFRVFGLPGLVASIQTPDHQTLRLDSAPTCFDRTGLYSNWSHPAVGGLNCINRLCNKLPGPPLI